jgi:hypothetical protein
VESMSGPINRSISTSTCSIVSGGSAAMGN